MVAESGFDQIMEAMKARYRRRLLFELRESNPQSVADTQRTAPHATGVGDRTEAGIRSMIHHTHLPKLEGMGYIRWNRQAGTVSTGPEWSQIAPFLGLLYEHGDELAVDWR